jgi:AcrR family transcriptional regulator
LSAERRAGQAWGDGVEEQRDRIVRAAWTVLERSGFEGFKVQLVLREADISARAFYRDFDDKDELVLALLLDEMSRAAPRLRAAVERVADPTGQVAVWIHSIIGAANDPRRSARARLFSSLPEILRRYPDAVAPGLAELRAPLREAIAAGVASGDFPWADPESDAVVIFDLAGSALSSSLGETPNPALDAVVTRTTTFALRALGAPPDRSGER